MVNYDYVYAVNDRLPEGLGAAGMAYTSLQKVSADIQNPIVAENISAAMECYLDGSSGHAQTYIAAAAGGLAHSSLGRQNFEQVFTMLDTALREAGEDLQAQAAER